MVDPERINAPRTVVSESRQDEAPVPSSTLLAELWNRFLRQTLLRTLRAVTEWICHCFLICVVLLGIRGCYFVLEGLWAPEPLIFFGKLPATQLLAAADFFALLGLLVLGVGCVVRAYRD